MTNSSLNAYGKVRDTCGNIGDVEACKHGVEHCNCRRKRSRTSESVSSDHYFTHKKPQNVVPEDSSFMARINPQFGHSKYSEQVHPNRSGNTGIGTLELKKKGARGNWREKAVQRGKTKYLWTVEVKNLPSEGKKGEPTSVGPVSSNPKSCPPRIGNAQNNISVQKAKELKSISTLEKEHCQMRQILSVKDIKISHAKNQKELGETASASQMSRRSQTCTLPEPNATLSPAIALTSTEVIKRTDGHVQRTISKKPCVRHSPMSVEEFFIKVAAEEPLPTDPAPDASWMGSFVLKDEKISISFQAHPTSRGLSKVKEFSKQMPQVLEFELCLYVNFFRTYFKGCDPDDKDIGLYFFPNNGIRLNEYISQLEKLSGDLFLRSCINGVELLVFTSKVLHKDYRNRNKSNFLWGMYRRRHGKGRGAVEETMMADRDNGLEDSHMAGVTEQSIDSNIDVPPGFSPSMRGHWIW